MKSSTVQPGFKSRLYKLHLYRFNLRKTRGRRPGERGSQGLDGDGGAAVKLYLQRPLLELRIPEPDLIFLTDLPGGLDSNEWIALHSELHSLICLVLSRLVGSSQTL